MTVEPPSIPLKGAPAVDYLPVVDLSDGRLLGMQARLRWVHPERGTVPHDRLVPWAEQNGTIVALGRWVLAQACEDAAAWSPSVQLAVRCSLQQLRQGEASKGAAVALEASGLAGHRLTLEVGELAVGDGAAAADLHELAGMGVELAVADVGTSWSSFEPFQRRAVTTVCVGASFVAGLEAADGMDRLVVETVVRMAHALGMAVIADGPSHQRQLALLRSLGVDAAAGPFFAPLLTGDQAAALGNLGTVPRFSLEAPRRLGDGRPVPLPVGSAEGDAAATPAAPRRTRVDSGGDGDESGGDCDDAAAGGDGRAAGAAEDAGAGGDSESSPPPRRTRAAKGSSRTAAAKAAAKAPAAKAPAPKKPAPPRGAGGSRRSGGTAPRS